MIARVDVSPDTKVESPLPWDASSWAPILDGAISIGSSMLFNRPRLRMPAQIGKVSFHSSPLPPKIGYVHVLLTSDKEETVDVNVMDLSGQILVSIFSMRFAEIEGTVSACGSVESLVHQISWPPLSLTEKPLALGHVMVISRDRDAVEQSRKVLKMRARSFTTYASVNDLCKSSDSSPSEKVNTAIMLYLPETIDSFQDVIEMGSRFCSELLAMVKHAASLPFAIKVFVITSNVMKGQTATALAQAPLYGLGRIISGEHSGIWGALIDTEDSKWTFVLQAIKYAQGGDIVRICDGVARAPVLRRLSRDKLLPLNARGKILPRLEGTYLITGGLGALGLEVAKFLVENNARRLVLLSRRTLPVRSAWKHAQGRVAEVCRAIENLEKMGATICTLSIDIASEGANQRLIAELNLLALPPVLGVVHAAGVLEDQKILESTMESFDRVLAPKLKGSMNLHQSFPVGTLDFMVLFSSCGQYFRCPGQGSYASGNAFLDTLASHRRGQGDNCVAIQWTSWRGMGMAASTDIVNAELDSNGITGISKEEAFRAWKHLVKHDMDHGVILRTRVLEQNEPLPAAILSEIATRQNAKDGGGQGEGKSHGAVEVPTSGPALLKHLDLAIRTCVAQTLHMASPDDVDPRAALSDLGVDSVMAVLLRTQLQKSLGVKMPPTILWSLPTISHLQKWFAEQMKAK